MPDPEAVGLCFTCRSARVTTNRRGSVFYRCLRAETDPRFTRYPTLPVRRCAGYEPKAHGDDVERSRHAATSHEDESDEGVT